MGSVSYAKGKRESVDNLSFRKAIRALLSLLVAVALAACATESHRALEPPKPASAGTAYTGPRNTLMVGKFDNRSSYMRGLFSDGVDRLGGQAKTILIGHLQETGRFVPVKLVTMKPTRGRSEERRVGKECRSRWSPYH